MRKITKRNNWEPSALADWKRCNPNKRYHQIDDVSVRPEIRMACTEEQFYICAYCCQAISGNNNDTMNEHVIPRDLDTNRTMDFTNMIASCTTTNQCDHSHGNRILPLTPFQEECERDLRFKLSGRVEGLTDAARATIQILNLGDHEENNRSIIEKRKQLVESIFWKQSLDPSKDLDDLIDDNDLINGFIDLISRPKEGKLDPFSPVAVNILRQLLSS